MQNGAQEERTSPNGVGSELAELMTVQEFAKLTRRTPSAVVAAILRGDVPAHKLGSRRWFIRRSDIMRMFEGA
jgi:excisionase family DNA binding protein